MKHKRILIFAVFFVCTFLLISCGNNDKPDDSELKEIEGVIFESAEFTYDGKEKSITAKNIPDDITFVYESNKGTDCGTYQAKLTLSGNGYKTKILTATLTINKALISGVTFESAEFTYDGTEKSIVAANIPVGIDAVYEQNKATDSGVYSAKVTLSANGYETQILEATLTVKKADINNISLMENESIKADGEFHLPTIIGTLPDNISTEWYFNENRSDVGVKAIGKYSVKLLISGKNYNQLTLLGNYEIKINLNSLASSVINTFAKTPTVWEFLPESLKVENYRIDEALPTYADFTDITAIPTKYIGKQLNVVLEAVNSLESALGYINTVQGTLNVIEQAYTLFLSNSPDNYSTFSDTTGSFTYSIILSENEYRLDATLGTVQVSLFSNIKDSEYSARIQLSDTNVLKYAVSENSLKIGINILNTSSTQVEFIRSEENNKILNGYIYEFLTVAGQELVSTSAYMHIDEKYTTVIGTKGDFIPSANGRNCEVYNNKTSKLIGSEVSEHIEQLNKTYDTLWYNLYDITGITSIKKIDEQNGYNADTVYINGSSDTIHTKAASFTDWSRRFDIEFKKVCAYRLNTETEKYEVVEFEVPMMFVQENHAETFNSDFNDKNSISVSLSASLDDKDAIYYGYHTLVDIYNTIKTNVTQNDIKTFCGIN